MTTSHHSPFASRRAAPDVRKRSIQALQTLWGKRHLGDESRELRLRFLSELCGRPIGSANDLTDRELRGALERLKREAGGVTFAVTNAQVFAIRGLEIDLQWQGRPERLARFLEKMFRVKSVNELSSPQGSKCIEALKAMRNRGRVEGNRQQSRDRQGAVVTNA